LIKIFEIIGRVILPQAFNENKKTVASSSMFFKSSDGFMKVDKLIAVRLFSKNKYLISQAVD